MSSLIAKININNMLKIHKIRRIGEMGKNTLCLVFACTSLTLMGAEDPFANSQTQAPSEYKGPQFALSHAYPGDLPPPPMPWRETLKGQPISKETASAYADVLKETVSTDMKVLIADYPAWNAGERGWFNQPWLSSIREPIHGMFQATTTNASLFNDPALKVNYMNDFGAVYYNPTAAVTLGRFWGSSAMKPNLITEAAQFPEGSIIVKLAFTQITAEEWPMLAGSPSWQIFANEVNSKNGNPADKPTLFNVQLLQMDIIVKDSVAAPKTGWVFSTLVYDNRIQGDFWQRMIPLGAMWGNDPDVNSSVEPGVRAPLNETWINPASPAYAQATLGWGGRLSGPNDQAVQAAGEYIDPATGKPGTVPVANSSCMSCHSPAEWQNQSFLMPGHIDEKLGYVMATPGSPDWFRWFQNRPGTVPMDEGSIALDYDMMFSFKALKLWAAANQKPVDNLRLFKRPSEMLLMKKRLAAPSENK